MTDFSSTNKHYRAIRQFYGAEAARRSKVPLMAHIDEGLAILDALGASKEAHEAFCLHPLLQADPVVAPCEPDPKPLMLAMEYRRVANAYLSHHFRGDADVIALSSEPEVNDMLVADKVQNRKDFEIHHLSTHANADVLARYFKNWLRQLGISEERYLELIRMLAREDRTRSPPA
jgi:hypothetical protein